MSLDEDPPAAPPASSAPSLSAVSIQLPPYWPADPEVWFAQVEVQFTTHGIMAQQTRFDYMVSSLGPQFTTEVRDLLLRPPAESSYDVLKTELIKRMATSEQRKLQQLISGEELGDRKPTQLLCHMQQLLGDKLGTSADSATFLHELFLQRLPANVQMVLASADPTTDLNCLADMADKVMDVAMPLISADAYTPPSERQQLHKEVSCLAELVASLTTHSRSHPRCHSSSRSCTSCSPASSHPSSSSSHDTADSPTLCFYHSRCRGNTRKCKSPCSWGKAPAEH